eukprot:CAMPEP_0202036802 /NCGR_PEP_ID=MMETSP0962-20130828/1782_1 /ASSEMBLY_ACC=CAM_ASM_000488 /TAXON_ID=4773 /ORGANISM="Schizochytrium aggregatum, Strain ATCC28209" /LENGTH=48 /DNA_ID= /DNA_START= /DNA_END= /DNA_ORIENTATION=
MSMGPYLRSAFMTWLSVALVIAPKDLPTSFDLSRTTEDEYAGHTPGSR